MDENAIFIRQHAECLSTVCQALKFSGRAFLALGFVQLVFEASILASFDELAFGVFLLDAAHTLTLLLQNRSKQPAADELCSALKSVADTHSIFAWVTSYQTILVILNYFDIHPSFFYSPLQSLTWGLKFLGAILALRYGGLRYVRTKITYWTRAYDLLGLHLFRRRLPLTTKIA